MLFLCFNRSISEYVRYIFNRESVETDVSTFHSLIMKKCGIKWTENLNERFYSQELPDIFMSKVIKQNEKYDVIIIDEGQDLFRNSYLQCVDKLLENGLSDGCWDIFFDPNQNIYIQDKQIDDVFSYLRKYSAYFRLSVNCRNTRQIVNANILVSNISQTQTYKANGLDVEYIAYSSLSEEFLLVRDCLLKIKNEGVSNREIVLLSEYRADNPRNCLTKGEFPKSIGKLVLDQYFWLTKKDEICFSTIHSFKGLDSNVILLLDVESFRETEKRLINYIAISRACTCLFLFYNKTRENERQEMLQNGFSLLK